LFTSTRQIVLVDKRTNTARLNGVRDSFARKHFCSYLAPDGQWSDELEDEWARLENLALPHARRLVNGDRDREGREAVKVLAAVHYVRSETYKLAHEHVAKMVIEDLRIAIGTDPEALEAFLADNGRLPQPSELENTFDNVAERWTEGQRLFIRSMADAYGKTFEILSPMYVQLVWPEQGRSDFVFGDQALVHYGTGGRVGIRQGVALGDASGIFLPIGPHLTAVFTRPRPFADCGISASKVKKLNNFTWRAAVRYIGVSPASDLNRSLDRWNIKVLP
jgi:hypothetical protein